MSYFSPSLALLVLASFMSTSVAEPTVVSTEALGAFTGGGAALHPDNKSPQLIRYYGTDLGFSYVHDGQIQFLFGDTWGTETYEPIETSTGPRFDDGFGSIALDAYPDPGLITSANMPLIKLGQNPGTTEMSAMNPGHAMDLGKTPMAGFSNGSEEFAIFNITKPLGCLSSDDCSNGLSCATGLGYLGTRYFEEENFTLPCRDGSPFCVAETMVGSDGEPLEGSGLCIDKTSTAWGYSDAGHVAAVGLTQRVALRSKENPKIYSDFRPWLTNKYVNVTATTVESFQADDSVHNYSPATGSGNSQRVFLWGRPGFIGVNAKGRTMGLYFAYVDMPSGPGFTWNVNYYTGTVDGMPQFSTKEKDASAVDLDSTQAGIQSKEVHDIANQMSVEWIAHLNKWVMFYGGGITKIPSPPLPLCGVLQLFTRDDCKLVDTGNGAVRMRTADHPWGPWSPPQDVIAGGDPDVPGSGQYGEGGMLNHLACDTETCAPHTQSPFYKENEYGFFYSANIIVPWIVPVGDGVDVLWNASTWDPYRVVLLRTRIDP